MSNRDLTLPTFLLVAVLAAGILSSDPAAADNPVPRPHDKLASCTLAGGVEALCGTYAVWENRETGQGRRIDLQIVVLPALEEPLPDPIVYLSGGPGQAATREAAAVGRFLTELRRYRDMIFIDQRGTGDSNGLDCQLYPETASLQDFLGDLAPLDAVRACRKDLEQRADLRFYSTPIAIEDLDEVRQFLGYGKVNLFGGSYGSLAALTYLNFFPDSVRTVAILGVVPPTKPAHIERARNAQRSLSILFQDCSVDAACHAAFPDLDAEFDAVTARLRKEPAHIEMKHPMSGELQQVEMDHEAFALTVLYAVWQSTTAVQLPSLIHQAAQGNYEPVVRLTVMIRRLIWSSLLAEGMAFSVYCSEDTPRIDPASVTAESAGTFLGDARVRQQIEICREWPRGDVPAKHFEPVRSDVPVLMLSGWLDWLPPRWAEEAATYLPNSLHVVGRYGHHDYPMTDPPCLEKVVAELFDRGSVRGLDTSCLETIERPPFNVTDDFRALFALSGQPTG